MISKIIQKEKERQEMLRTGPQDETDVDFQDFHNQSLINLKEYLESLRSYGLTHYNDEDGNKMFMYKDIQELNKMIEKYN